MSAPLAGMRIGLLTASASRLGGGVFEAVLAQAALIRNLGGEPLVFALDDPASAADAPRFAPTPVAHFPVRGPGQPGFAPGLVKALLAADLACLHLHGIWLYPSFAGWRWARRTGRRYVVSPHGMLDPWIVGRGQWKKALARAGYERASWSAAAVLHALTASEQADLRRETGRNDAVLIPNPAPPAMAPDAVALREPVAVYIGRIHPKKNLLALIEAWRMATLPAGARLKIAGWGDAGDVAALEAAMLAAGASVEFCGPLYGEEKQRLLDEARFGILPSHSEGLPMAVLECWAAATPVLMSQACNLPIGFTAGAALDCGTTAESIRAALETALAMPQDRWDTMRKAALALAGGPFAAPTIAAAWAAAYRGPAQPQGGQDDP